MSKSKRRKQRKQARRGERRPDEAFAAGPFEFARYGRVVVGRSRLDEAQWAKVQAELAERYPDVVAELDALVTQIADRVAGLPPAKLLQRAFFMFITQRIAAGGSEVSSLDEGLALRMVDYVQSVIAAVPPRLPYSEDVDDEAWAALREDVGALFGKLQMQFPMTRTASRRAQDTKLDMALEAFQVRTEMLWTNVRGARHQTEERQALAEVLEPHAAILTELFGLDAASLATEMEKIQTALTHGMAKATEDMAELQHETMTRFKRMVAQGTPLGQPADVFANDAALRQRAQDVMGRLFGFDLFDVRKTTNLPDNLLQALSFAPGEDDTFFAPGEHSGWPLRVWPTMRRPFLRLDDKIYCFDRYALFDNMYRAIQRVVLQLAPQYRARWNEGQQAISEALPFRYLEQLLPGSLVVRPIYYRWAPEGGQTDWHEADGLVAYDDHLILLEIKAGAFTWTSPTTDLAAHLRSLTALVQAPAAQSRRFLDYLESTPEAVLYNADHVEIGRIRLSDYRQITRATVTLDPFTESAARAQHLRSIGVDVGPTPVWVLSVDDLRVCAEIFPDPLNFLHFVEQRLEAAHSDLVDLDDELDHLGMYLKENQYGRLARDLAESGRRETRFTGYREIVDAYFERKVLGEDPDPPTQPLPARLSEILALLEARAQAGRARISAFLLDAAGDERSRMHRQIEKDIANQKADEPSRPVSSYGEQAFTMQVWTPAQPRNAQAALDHVQAVMAAANEQSRLLLELIYDREDRLADMQWRHVGVAGLDEAQLAKIHADGESLKRRRVAAARTKGWIRPKAQCPCGSGLKFKDCHLG